MSLIRSLKELLIFLDKKWLLSCAAWGETNIICTDLAKKLQHLKTVENILLLNKTSELSAFSHEICGQAKHLVWLVEAISAMTRVDRRWHLFPRRKPSQIHKKTHDRLTKMIFKSTFSLSFSFSFSFSVFPCYCFSHDHIKGS